LHSFCIPYSIIFEKNARDGKSAEAREMKCKTTPKQRMNFLETIGNKFCSFFFAMPTSNENYGNEKKLIFTRSELHFCEILRNDFRGFNSRRLHHFEFIAATSVVLRMARLVPRRL